MPKKKWPPEHMKNINLKDFLSKAKDFNDYWADLIHLFREASHGSKIVLRFFNLGYYLHLDSKGAATNI